MKWSILRITLCMVQRLMVVDSYTFGHNYGYSLTIREDTLGYDSNLHVVHLYKDQWPTGTAVSKSGRKFSCYPAGLDETNTNNGQNRVYQVAELTGFDTERPYPNLPVNNPPGGSIDFTQSPPVTKGLRNYLISVLAVVIDFNDTMWLLDSGRVLHNGTLLPASPGGTKLITINLTTDSITQIYTFPTTVAKPTSLFDDVRIDTERHFAYISDISDVNDNAIVVMDLTSGRSWRTLERDVTVLGIVGTVPFVWGEPVYQPTGHTSHPGNPGFISFGVDGIALSSNLDTLYYSVVAGRFLYSVPTALLRDRHTPAADISASIRNLGEKGISGGMVSDSNGTIYMGNHEQCGVSMYDPTTRKTELFVRDKRINWVDTITVAEDGYLYFTVNQANYAAGLHSGMDLRQKPYVLFRVRLPGLATKGPGS